MNLTNITVMILKGMLPAKVEWIADATADLIEGIPVILNTKTSLDAPAKEQIAELVADILDEVPEVTQIEAKILGDAVVIIADKIIRAVAKKKIILSRRKRRFNV